MSSLLTLSLKTLQQETGRPFPLSLVRRPYPMSDGRLRREKGLDPERALSIRIWAACERMDFLDLGRYAYGMIHRMPALWGLRLNDWRG